MSDTDFALLRQHSAVRETDDRAISRYDSVSLIKRFDLSKEERTGVACHEKLPDILALLLRCAPRPVLDVVTNTTLVEGAYHDGSEL